MHPGDLQEHVTGDYTKYLRVLYALPDGKYKRSFVDAFHFMFADGRGRESRQIWNLPPVSKEQKECRQEVHREETRSSSTGPIKIPNFFRPLYIHMQQAQAKAALHIPHGPRPENPRVVWVARNTSLVANPTEWQRR